VVVIATDTCLTPEFSRTDSRINKCQLGSNRRIRLLSCENRVSKARNSKCTWWNWNGDLPAVKVKRNALLFPFHDATP